MQDRINRTDTTEGKMVPVQVHVRKGIMGAVLIPHFPELIFQLSCVCHQTRVILHHRITIFRS